MGHRTDCEALIAEARSFAAGSGSYQAATLLTSLADALEGEFARDTKLDKILKIVQDNNDFVRDNNARIVAAAEHAFNGDEPLTGDTESPLIEHGKIPDTPPPPTRFGCRVTYVDGTGEDHDNIDGVQIYDHKTGTFPFGFVPIADEDGTDCHRAVWYDEEGVPHAFSGDQQERPFEGW